MSKKMIDPNELGEKVVKVLKTIYDPEIPVDIYELGLIYDVFLNEENDVKILMTLTSPNCPVAESLPQEVKDKVAEIKGVKNIVAGDADVLLVPSVETGNALVKIMIYFMGACAAGVVIGGKVPVVITSRSDEASARLASIAAAVVALD